ncbi:hypothetical protein CKAN_01931400 [Cinnamomum micranthum f. kanehirae]|uniref:Uncharacterized protein n=1 Tax=Cinnamomum micranthum f. kanehirae TaxID=337451 RepID=A0A443PHI7_9MAGN|nr:hypothetical protein CKAN_01931400 [Cinnamomum micranthum f. kanehirae]
MYTDAKPPTYLRDNGIPCLQLAYHATASHGMWAQAMGKQQLAYVTISQNAQREAQCEKFGVVKARIR